MFRRLALLATSSFAALVLSGPASAGGPTMTLGAAEDIVRADTLVSTKAKMSLFRLVGFTAVRVTSNWKPGETAPPTGELTVLRNIEAAARLAGVRVYVSVYQPGSKTTPLTPNDRAEFAQYTAAIAVALPSFDDVIVGNEPNLNRFWLPQFSVDGANASAPAYLALLAQTYDALKAVDPTIRVWGGALAPRGSDRPEGARQTSSPTAFIHALGKAYRASGRTLAVMDGFTFHPYPDTSSQAPDTTHPKTTTIGLADYDKLVGLLGQAFDGTPQLGSMLPILYDEYGIESQIPSGKAKSYTGTEPTTTMPVDERTQASSYGRALQIAFCQPNVVGMLLFHSQDESALGSWQSGVYYADGSPKASLYALRDALRRTRGGSVARCAGLALDVTATQVRFPTPSTFQSGARDVRFRCTLDCAWELRAVGAVDGTTIAATRGYGQGGLQLVASLKGRKLGAGRMRLSLTVSHPVNPGVPESLESVELRVP